MTLPYVSLPIAYTDPSRLAALAVLHGLSPPDVTTSRVLELGCASGGNLIPLAARYPSARFTGLDLASADIALAEARVATLGLSNVAFKAADIAAAGAIDGTFDYIICHGVYSWVPDHVRAAIFELCGRHLAANGIAVISFNVLPGWHLRQTIRDICLTTTNKDAAPLARAAEARGVLSAIARSAPDGIYGRLLRTEAADIAKLPAAYILGEFLAEQNAPCHFRDFAASLARHELAYLCEGDLPACAPETVAPAAAAEIRARAGGDQIAREHFTDLFSGRPFRRSLIVRSEALGSAGAMDASAARLDTLHVAATARAEKAAENEAAASAILRRLVEAQPATIPAAELLVADTGTPEHAREDLWTLLRRGLASAGTVPIHFGRADSARPLAFALARLEAAEGQPWVTGLDHRAKRIDAASRLLLPLLDGTRDHATLTAALASALADGRLKRRPPEAAGGANVEPSSAGPVDASALLRRTLASLHKDALLLPV